LIWELKDSGCYLICGFQDFATLGVDHFNNLYKEPTKVKMVEILKLISLFLRLIEEVDNHNLFREIFKKLLAILSSFKRDKRSGPNGWNEELFKEFFDVFMSDLLREME
jgi:hypothetical protein